MWDHGLGHELQSYRDEYVSEKAKVELQVVYSYFTNGYKHKLSQCRRTISDIAVETSGGCNPYS